MADLGSCTLEATVVTGFEFIVKEECKAKFQVDGMIEKGRVFFVLPIERVNEALNLRGIDNLYVLVTKQNTVDFPSDKELALSKLSALPNDIDWYTGLTVWQKITGYNKVSLKDLLSSGLNDSSSNKNEVDAKGDCATSQDVRNTLNFRATCYRSGQNHSFSSVEAASAFGGAINDMFKWKVSLKIFDIEVVLHIHDSKVYSTIALTKESLHHRNLFYFGPTSLRATIAHNMLRLCRIKPGDVVCDPMCGGGSIPLEGAQCWPESFILCGDNHPLATERTQQNIKALNKKLLEEERQNIKINLFKWDACCLPLLDNSVDVFITDLPFGKRIGTKSDNRVLYPLFLREMARVCREVKGRSVLLTQDKRSLIWAIGRYSIFWHQSRVIGVNIGGLAACVFILHRTSRKFTQLYDAS